MGIRHPFKGEGEGIAQQATKSLSGQAIKKGEIPFRDFAPGMLRLGLCQ